MDSLLWQLANDYVLPALATLLGTALTLASLKLTTFLHRKVENETAQGVTVRLNETVLQVVLELEQTAVAEAKAAMDPKSEGGRRITGDEAARIRDTAISKVRSYLGPAGLALLVKVLGFGGDTATDDYIGSKVEATIHGLKLEHGGQS